MTWQDGDEQEGRILGSGSISCLGLTEEQGADAERRRGPLGFGIPPALEEFVSRAARATLAARSAATERLVVEALAAAGESAWTAPDTFVIVEFPDGRIEVR